MKMTALILASRTVTNSAAKVLRNLRVW